MEAVFVMSIVVWILVSVCYLALYSHDRAVLYSLGQNYLEMSVENGADTTAGEIRDGMKGYLQKYMLITRVDSVRVTRGIRTVKAEVAFCPEIQLSMTRELLGGSSGGHCSISHEVIVPSHEMWDLELMKEQEKWR